MTERRVVVDGVCILLTDAQINQIDKEKKKREKCRNSFTKMLKHFGFTPLPDLPGSFENKATDWYAEIQDGNGWSEVFMVGKGLKNGGFPGGWMYGSPEDIETEIVRALQETDFTK